jgi:hypothetical protein
LLAAGRERFHGPLQALGAAPELRRCVNAPCGSGTLRGLCGVFVGTAAGS